MFRQSYNPVRFGLKPVYANVVSEVINFCDELEPKHDQTLE